LKTHFIRVHPSSDSIVLHAVGPPLARALARGHTTAPIGGGHEHGQILAARAVQPIVGIFFWGYASNSKPPTK